MPVLVDGVTALVVMMKVSLSEDGVGAGVTQYLEVLLTLNHTNAATTAS